MYLENHHPHRRLRSLGTPPSIAIPPLLIREMLVLNQ